MYKCITNFSSFEGKFFKGAIYESLPKNHRNFFVKISEKREVEVAGETVETASIDVKPEKRTRKRK